MLYYFERSCNFYFETIYCTLHFFGRRAQPIYLCYMLLFSFDKLLSWLRCGGGGGVRERLGSIEQRLWEGLKNSWIQGLVDVQRRSPKVATYCKENYLQYQTTWRSGALACWRCKVCFKLHFNVVSPPYLLCHGLYLFQLHELRGWKYHLGGLLWVDMLHVYKKKWGGARPILGLEAAGCQISM